MYNVYILAFYNYFHFKLHLYLTEKAGKDSFFKHLLIDHSVVIGDIHLVANLPQYIK